MSKPATSVQGKHNKSCYIDLEQSKEIPRQQAIIIPRRLCTSPALWLFISSILIDFLELGGGMALYTTRKPLGHSLAASIFTDEIV